MLRRSVVRPCFVDPWVMRFVCEGPPQHAQRNGMRTWMGRSTSKIDSLPGGASGTRNGPPVAPEDCGPTADGVNAGCCAVGGKAPHPPPATPDGGPFDPSLPALMGVHYGDSGSVRQAHRTQCPESADPRGTRIGARAPLQRIGAIASLRARPAFCHVRPPSPDSNPTSPRSFRVSRRSGHPGSRSMLHTATDRRRDTSSSPRASIATTTPSPRPSGPQRAAPSAINDGDAFGRNFSTSKPHHIHRHAMPFLGTLRA